MEEPDSRPPHEGEDTSHRNGKPSVQAAHDEIVSPLPEQLASPTPERMLFDVLQLNRDVSVEMHDEEIVHRYLTTMQNLFPGRRFAIQLVHGERDELGLAYATGSLMQDRRDAINITREAIERHGLTTLAVRSPLQVAARYTPLFEPEAEGFDVPIIDGGHLAGVLSVEYPRSHASEDSDPHLLVPMTLQLGASLRNARLLRESMFLRDYLGKLLEHANAPVLVIGPQRQIRVANRALLQLTGYSREDLLGQDFMSLVPEEDRPQLLPVYISALRGKAATSFELRLPRRGGGFVRVAMNTAAILGPDGEVESVIAIGRDLTELRELQQRVIQAEKLATVGQMAAGVVHELNNPLTSISVYSNYLLRNRRDQEAGRDELEKLERISSGAERIMRFTRELLAYARPTVEAPKMVDVPGIVQQSLQLCDHITKGCGASVETRFEKSLPPLFGVANQIEQVLVNLITNACHAMPEGAGQLAVDADYNDEGIVMIRIRDNGGGIAPDHLGHIFEPFFSTKGEGKGTGLGLSIVRNIIELHNGSIDVESELGIGTSFILRFAGHNNSGDYFE